RQSGHKIHGIIAALGELIGRKDKAPAFGRNMLHRSHPDWSLVCGRRTIKLDPLPRHRRAHERHVVLQGNPGTETSELAIEDGHGRPVAIPPYQSLERG